MKPELIEKLKGMFSEAPVMCAGNADLAEIGKLEGKLGFHLPSDYKEFVTDYGGAIVGAYSIYGLGAAPAMSDSESSAWEVTQRFRMDGWPGVEEWLVISSDHSGNPIGIDKTGRVLLSDHDTRTIEVISSNFEGYLEKWCLKE